MRCAIRLCALMVVLPTALGIANGDIISHRSSLSSTALVHVSRRVRAVRGLGYRTRNEYCTGSLISRQVVITAGHCIQGKRGSTLVVNFLDKKKLFLFRMVRKFYIFRQKNGSDIALLLLTKPIMLCDPKEKNASERIDILRLPLGNAHFSGWNDRAVESGRCVMYGYGRSELNNRIDYRLRSMPVNLKVQSPLLTATLAGKQKICEGDSGGPVVCERDGVRYLIGISTSVISTKTSKKPQLCGMRVDDKYAVITGAKFYDIRHGIPRILRFLRVHKQLNNLIDDYKKCF